MTEKAVILHLKVASSLPCQNTWFAFDKSLSLFEQCLVEFWPCYFSECVHREEILQCYTFFAHPNNNNLVFARVGNTITLIDNHYPACISILFENSINNTANCHNYNLYLKIFEGQIPGHNLGCCMA